MSRTLSIVIPVYNEAESLPLLYASIDENIQKTIALGLIDGCELWFIDDGSTDGSNAVIRGIIQQNPRVRLIVFRKNFGKAAALQSGFFHCSGDIVITMDADLQDDPAEIPQMIALLDSGFDLVSGWKRDRKDPLEKRVPSRFFNGVTATLSGVRLHDFNCGFKAYRREVVKSIDLYGEMHRYIPVLARRKGFRITEMPVTHHKREFGKSKYGVERYLRGLFDSLTTSFLSRFYDRPMYFFGRIGLALLLLGIVICAVLAVEWFMGNSIGTRPLLTLGVMCVILGVQSISTGFIGDMLVDATFRSRYAESHVKEIVNGTNS